MADKNPNGQEDAITLSPEQMEMVRQGLESLERGEQFSQEEVRRFARDRVRSWLNPPSQSA